MDVFHLASSGRCATAAQSLSPSSPSLGPSGLNASQSVLGSRMYGLP